MSIGRLVVFLREGFSLGKDDYLSCECQAGTEADLQGELAGEFRVLLEQAVRGEGGPMRREVLPASTMSRALPPCREA